MDEQQLAQIAPQVAEAAKAAVQGDQQAKQALDQLQPDMLQYIAQMVAQQDQEGAQAIMQIVQSRVQQAKFGAKLTYIQRLRGECPDGYEMQYFKKGGQVCKKCMKKVQAKQEGGNVIEEFKCGQKMKRAKKAECGTKIKSEKCGGSAPKKACGGVKMSGCGSKVKLDKCGGKQVKKKANGGSFIPFQNRGLSQLQNPHFLIN